MLPSNTNNYADAEPSAPTGPPDKATEPEKEEKGDDQTAEIPKAVLGGGNPKPGDKCEFEVVQVMEDSVLVKYASEEKEAQPEEAPPPEASAPPQGGPMTGMLS